MFPLQHRSRIKSVNSPESALCFRPINKSIHTDPELNEEKLLGATATVVRRSSQWNVELSFYYLSYSITCRRVFSSCGKHSCCRFSNRQTSSRSRAKKHLPLARIWRPGLVILTVTPLHVRRTLHSGLSRLDAAFDMNLSGRRVDLGKVAFTTDLCYSVCIAKVQ